MTRRLARRASRLPAAVTAAAAAAVAFAWVRGPQAGGALGDGPAGAPRARPSFVDAAVRRLRAAVVGDVVTGDVPAPGASPDPRAAPAARARQALAARVRGRLRPDGGAAAAAPNAVTPGVPWWADSAHWGPEVIRRRDEARPAVALAAGDTLTVAAPALPALLPAALRRRGVYWTADGGVALVPADDGDTDRDGARRVVAVAPGDGTVTAVTAVGRTVTPVRVRPAVRGRVYAADEGAPGRGGAPRARVVVARDGAAPDTAWTDAAGAFRLALPAGWDGAADVRVEPLAAPLGAGDAPTDDALGEGSGYAPVALGRVRADALHALGVVLVPRRWAIAAGAYAGTAVPLRAERARGFWPVAAAATGPGGASAGGASARRAVGWPDDAARTVAFEPGGPAADTAAFWAAARALGRAWGRPLFAPAPAGADADVTVRVTPGLGALGLTTLGWGGAAGGGRVGGARVEFRTAAAAADARVVQHELLHALGFGHARGWASVLAPAGAAGAPAATVADVAYGQAFEGVRRQARRAARELGAAYGLGSPR